MRIRVGDVMKIVAILAVGLGYGEWFYRQPRETPVGPD